MQCGRGAGGRGGGGGGEGRGVEETRRRGPARRQNVFEAGALCWTWEGVRVRVED